MRQLTVGTRGSALALWQTRFVNQQLTEALTASQAPVPRIEVRVVTTKGDVDMTEKLAGKLEKGFFTAELENELRANTIDWAVHSLKDLPTRLADDLPVVAVLPRARAADLLLVRPEATEQRAPHLLPLKDGARVGSSSLRREAMMKRFGPTVKPQPLRGNVTTRMQKLRSGQYDAILLAAAGVDRLGLDLTGLDVHELNPRQWQPAPGQGAIAAQARSLDPDVKDLFARIDHPDTAASTERERAFLRVLEGGCTTPFGCYVADGVAWLGLETAGGWRSLAAKLPEAGALDAKVMAEVLANLSADHEEKTDQTWLYRPA